MRQGVGKNPRGLITEPRQSDYNPVSLCLITKIIKIHTLATWIVFAQKISVLKPKNSKSFNFITLYSLSILIMYN